MGNAYSKALGRKMTDSEAHFYNEALAFTKSILWLHVGDNGLIDADLLTADLLSTFEVDYRQTEMVKLTGAVAQYWSREWAQGNRSQGSMEMLRKYRVNIAVVLEGQNG